MSRSACFFRAVAAEAPSPNQVGGRVLCVDYRNPVMNTMELDTLDFFSLGRL